MKMRAYLLGLLLAVLALAFCTGCASTDPITIPGETIYVTDYEKPEKFEIPPEPDWNLLGVSDSAEWREWFEAQSKDLGLCIDQNADLRHILESWNQTVDEMPDKPSE